MATIVEPGKRSATLEPRTVRRAVEMYLRGHFGVKPQCNCPKQAIIQNCDEPDEQGQTLYWTGEAWGTYAAAKRYTIADAKATTLPAGGAWVPDVEPNHVHDPIGVTLAADGSAHVILADESPDFPREPAALAS